MSDYSKAYSKYGASMGRKAFGKPGFMERMALHRVLLDQGGYDPGGAYWGSGAGTEALWRLQGEDCEAYIRAPNRGAAWMAFQQHFGCAIHLRSPLRAKERHLGIAH